MKVLEMCTITPLQYPAKGKWSPDKPNGAGIKEQSGAFVKLRHGTSESRKRREMCPKVTLKMPLLSSHSWRPRACQGCSEDVSVPVRCAGGSETSEARPLLSAQASSDTSRESHGGALDELQWVGQAWRPAATVFCLAHNTELQFIICKNVSFRTFIWLMWSSLN